MSNLALRSPGLRSSVFHVLDVYSVPPLAAATLENDVALFRSRYFPLTIFFFFSVSVVVVLCFGRLCLAYVTRFS